VALGVADGSLGDRRHCFVSGAGGCSNVIGGILVSKHFHNQNGEPYGT